LSFTESRFVSKPDNGRRESWKSRNVPMAKRDVPRMGAVTVFSVHTGWWDDPDEPFQDQYRRLLDLAAEVNEPASMTILCGDFNIAAGSPGYPFMTQGTGFSDQYALANPDGMFDATIGGRADGWEDSSSGQRIDYILMNDDSSLEVKRARRAFTKKVLGRVSDHVGIYAEFEIAQTR
jgi:maltose 6'-phosphate phosphatase